MAGACQLLGQHGDLVRLPHLAGTFSDFGGCLLPSVPTVADGGPDDHEDHQDEGQVRDVRDDSAVFTAAGVSEGAPELEVNSRQQGRSVVQPESDRPQCLHDDLLGEHDGDRPHSQDLRWSVETCHQPHADEAEGRDEGQLDDDPHCAPGIPRQGPDSNLVGDDQADDPKKQYPRCRQSNVRRRRYQYDECKYDIQEWIRINVFEV